MWNKIKSYTLAHLIGLIFLLGGWFMAVIDAALDRFSTKSIFSGTTVTGLVLILIGAYLPEIWITIANKRKSDDT